MTVNNITKYEMSGISSTEQIRIIKKLNIDKDIKFALIQVGNTPWFVRTLPKFGYNENEVLIFSNVAFTYNYKFYAALWMVIDTNIMADYSVMLTLELGSVIVATYTPAELTRQLYKHETIHPEDPTLSLSRELLIERESVKIYEKT